MAGKLTPQPLPENHFPSDTDIRKAYDQCLALEQHESRNSSQSDLHRTDSRITTSDTNPQVLARILGYSILFAPSEDGRTALTREIIGCEGNSELLFVLAYLYVYGMIGALYNPSPINPRSFFGLEDCEDPEDFEDIKDLGPCLKPEEWTPEMTAAWDLREQLLTREDNRCIFSGAYDFTQIKMRPPLEDPSVLWIFSTSVTYIISKFLSEDIHLPDMSRACEKFEWATTARAIIEHFGGLSFHDLLGEDVLNGPLNGFTTASDAQYIFKEFDVWLIPAEDDHQQVVPNTYDLQCYLGNDFLPWIAARGVKSRITFRSIEVDHKTIPPPHPRLIGLHSACARIAHMSGAMKYLKEWFQDPDYCD